MKDYFGKMRQDYRRLCYKCSIEGKAWLPFPKTGRLIRKININRKRKRKKIAHKEVIIIGSQKERKDTNKVTKYSFPCMV